MRLPLLLTVLLFGCGSGETEPGGTDDDGAGASGSSAQGTGATTGATGGAGATGATGSVSSSSSATSGAGGGGSGGGTTSVGTGGEGGGPDGVGTPCAWNQDPACPDGLYCFAPGCGLGTCQLPAGAETPEYTPVCGCDGHIFWNESVAARFGESVKHDGHCGFMDGPHFCDAGPCPAGMFCNQYVGNGQNACPFALDEICWGLPATCEAAGDPGAYACGSTACASRCELMKAETPFFGGSGATCSLCDPIACFDTCFANGMFGQCVDNACVCS